MRKINYLFQLLIMLLIVIASVFNSCVSTDDSYDFTIQVDSITFPQTWVNNFDTLKVAFWGKIGDTECHSFKSFTVDLKTDTAIITATGHRRVIYREGCQKADIQLSGRTCDVHPLREGSFTVIVIRPNGGRLEKQIWIH